MLLSQEYFFGKLTQGPFLLETYHCESQMLTDIDYYKILVIGWYFDARA